ncbi:MAG: hypothetical protein IMF19_12200 [Proteobacteria bacterium]|nr:hypothetical protein [Pseudomonadota bacterium]
MTKKMVFWKSELTGEEGHGEPLPPSIADAWVTYGNEKFPEVIHMAIEAKVKKFEWRIIK